ncbi:MAG TPA: hypothetical protein VI112_16290 [Bacteroidia bacterium]|jgi:hypothetical protein
MNGIIGSLLFVLIALYFLYYLIERLVVGKFSSEAFKENAMQILIVLFLFAFAIVFYLGRNPTY